MTRSRSSAKAAGARFERVIADALRDHVDDRIDRRVKTGNKDKGDIANVRMSAALAAADASRVVVECKDYGGRIQAGPWIGEAETERINDDAAAGVVVFKRRGISDPLQQGVLMTVADLVTLLTGDRP